MTKKIALGLVALVAMVAGVVGLSAFEAHVINVTAKIENALFVPTDEIDFGTVFPQEQLDKFFDITLSRSFMEEDRVDDVEYLIRQKPKCGITTDDGQTLVGPTATGHVSLGPGDEVIIDCGPAPRELNQETETWGVLPLLCPYLSKHEITKDAPEDDVDVPAFHQPWTFSNHQVVWTQALGRLSKKAGDILDTWKIDLKVPCFGNYCAQDWEAFVAGINPNALPASQWVQDIKNQHKIFGCDLWIEVFGISLPCVPGTFTVVSDTTNTVNGDGNAVAVSPPYHSEWTAVIPGATWIWSEDPTSTQLDQTETFVKQFNVSGASVTVASLMIATDNTYSVKVNTVPVCSSADEDNFHLGTQDVCPVTNLNPGLNTLEITVTNKGVGNDTSNPGGLLYKLSYTTVCETLGCSEKVDVMLVLDRSGSINDAEEALMKTGAKAFVDALSPLSNASGAIMGMSSFGTTGSPDQELTDVAQDVKDAIDAITTPGASLTNLFEGIKLAKEELGGANDRLDADAPDFMVVITDGNPNQPPDAANARAVAKAEADAAKELGIEIFVVGIGGDVDATYLKTIASGDDHYYSADFASLEAVLKTLTVCENGV